MTSPESESLSSLNFPEEVIKESVYKGSCHLRGLLAEDRDSDKSLGSWLAISHTEERGCCRGRGLSSSLGWDLAKATASFSEDCCVG